MAHMTMFFATIVGLKRNSIRSRRQKQGTDAIGLVRCDIDRTIARVSYVRNDRHSEDALRVFVPRDVPRLGDSPVCVNAPTRAKMYAEVESLCRRQSWRPFTMRGGMLAAAHGMRYTRVYAQAFSGAFCCRHLSCRVGLESRRFHQIRLAVGCETPLLPFRHAARLIS